jgi:HSP20 family protein
MFKSYDDMVEEFEREMRRLSDDMLLNMFRLPAGSVEVWTPRVDVYETSEDLVVKVCAAGIDPSEVEITLSADDKFLTVRGVRGETDEDRHERMRYYQLEVYYGPFQRIIALPPDVKVDRDRLAATYSEGFLLIVLPKYQVEKKRRPRKVKVTD